MKISKPNDTFQYCPTCQSDKISTTDGHRFYCFSCGFEYFHNTASAVAGIVLCSDEILLTTRAKEPAKGKLDLPGGFVDHNETLEQALTREVKEELNVTIKTWNYLTSGFNSYEYNGITYKTCDAVFYSSLLEKPKVTKDNTEISHYQWMNRDDIDLNLIGFPSLKIALKHFLTLQMQE